MNEHPTLFHDRADAGRQLARSLLDFSGRDVVILALPRGGVPVAAQVARSLGAPLDVFIVRKLGLPGHEELAMGAIASGGVRVLNDEVVQVYGIPERIIDEVTERERRELERRERDYHGQRPPPEVAGRTVILIDDGLATGSTMRAAVRALRLLDPRRIIVAVPVGAPPTCAMLGAEADAIVCLAMPEPFLSVGSWYEDFSQTSDAEVRAVLEPRTQ